MTREELIESMTRAAKSGIVEYNELKAYIKIIRGDGEEYYFQGEEATRLLEEVPDWSSPRLYLLWLAEGWA